VKRREFIAGLAGAAAWPLAAQAQQLVGAWRATNQCFLAAFILMEGGRTQAAYLSGERDDNAVWTWDGQHAADHVGDLPVGPFHRTLDE
jgi:hypothetical protein